MSTNLIDSRLTYFPIERMSGLRPQVWVSVGAGFAREDVKALILSQGHGFVGDAVVTLQELCLKITHIESERNLNSSTRQEILRTLLAEPKILGKLQEIKRIKRQRNFVRRLDSAIQTGRMAFAHEAEEEVYEERLNQTLGENELRKELKALGQAYEVWLEASGAVDQPMLIRTAIQVLREGWPKGLSRPQEIWNLSVQNPESLEKEFWDVLGHYVTVKQIQVFPLSTWRPAEVQPAFEWQRWHTLDDAAEFLADQLLMVNEVSEWEDHAVLIPDIPSIRRSLRRAFEARGLPLADPRDPTRLRWDETVKWALLPLEVVALNFDRQRVTSWLKNYRMAKEFPEWVAEINSRGIRNGIYSYQGGSLSEIHEWLKELNGQFGGRRKCDELVDCHLKMLRPFVEKDPERQWLIPFFDQLWKIFISDMEKVGFANKKAPLLFWLERLQTRLSEATPPVEKLKPSFGIRLYRLQQAPVKPAKRVWIFGLPPHWLSGEGTGSYWFSEREREILSAEFAVRSCNQVREERLEILKSWASSAGQITLLDSQFDSDGRERESVLPILKELEVKIGEGFKILASEEGSHFRYTQSYSAIRPIQPQKFELPPLVTHASRVRPEVTATTLERFSRCPFQALAYHRWNLRDVREPDTELWPDVRGNILHEAVRLLLRSLKKNDPNEGQFGISIQDALDQAWKSRRPRGLIRSERIEKYVKSRLIAILETFCEKEKEYIQQSGVRPMSLEDLNLRLEYPQFTLIGQPDRIDQHPEGLFIIDYKTSGTVPHGSEMIENGYRLQLPFYAVAASKKLNQPVLGVQFVELNRRGGRKSGIFFKAFNGKEKGKLTAVRSNSKSLIQMEPEQAWSILEDHLIQDAATFVQGKFEAMPKVPRREKECSQCHVADLCGFRRLLNPIEDSVNGSREK